MAPGERIKCLLQIQAQAVDRGEKPLYNGMVDCAKKLYKTGGISSIFRGWEATLLRDIPGYVLLPFAWHDIRTCVYTHARYPMCVYLQVGRLLWRL